jgi:hypothetical protein
LSNRSAEGARTLTATGGRRRRSFHAPRSPAPRPW